MPEVTVLMPIFNCRTYLAQSIESILGQTYRDFEFLIIDDGSTDGSQEVVKGYDDSRIRLLQNKRNLGVAASLNKGIRSAKGSYIARMDGDDHSCKDRLKRQVALLERRTSVGICGSWVRTRNLKGHGHVIRFPLSSPTVGAYLLFNNPLAHPAVMIRRQELLAQGLFYDETCEAGQDYEFWSRCARCFDIENIPRPLLVWRIHQDGVTHRKFNKSNATAMKVQKDELSKLGIVPSEDEASFHRAVGNSSGFSTLTEIRKACEWLELLLQRNLEFQAYSPQGLRQVVAMIWFRLCLNSSGMGVRVLMEYLRAPFFRSYRPPLAELLYFLLNSTVKMRRGPGGKLLGSQG